MKVHEIFSSVSGEFGLFPQGSWVTFVRLAGCNLRCSYCDTEKAQTKEAGTEMTEHTILERVDTLGNKRVLITGGEPLTQDIGMLVQLLLMTGHQIQIETNGSIAPYLEWPVAWIVDYKMPGSGEFRAMPSAGAYAEWLRHSSVYVKVVVTSEEDFQHACSLYAKAPSEAIRDNRLAISACPPLSHSALYGMMKRDGIKALFNVQIHKLASLKEN